MPKPISNLENKIKVNFKNKDLIKQALIHRSYLNENPTETLDHNERLEFLGDAVLELVVTDYLYNNHPNPEGDLTNWRSALVNAQIMGRIAQDMGVSDYLYLSHGESKDKGKARQAILANALEAIIGAIYLDSGYEGARVFIKNFMLVELPGIIENKLYRDSKSLFQEVSQERAGITPSYKVVSESGPDHNKVFKVGAYLRADLVAEGEGSSKQEAEQSAAENAIEAKGWE